nr:unnamed protein product [Callosobruchus chinensis]
MVLERMERILRRTPDLLCLYKLYPVSTLRHLGGMR